MARVARPGGQVIVVDMVSPDEPAVANTYNHLERLRDPSHALCLTGRELACALEQADLCVLSSDERWLENLAEDWLAFAGAEAATANTIRRQLADDVDGGQPTGMFPELRAGRLYIHRRITLLAAHKAPDTKQR